MAVAATMMRSGRCRACRLDLDPRAESCWFCSTPVPAASPTTGIATEAADMADDGVLFARGVLLGIAVVLVPFAVHLTALSG